VPTQKKRISLADVFVDFREMRKREKANRQVLIRCTEQERQSIKRTAKELGLPVSYYLRSLHRAALKSAGREIEP
jgi:predicted DNA binding CopG/RHH family protein